MAKRPLNFAIFRREHGERYERRYIHFGKKRLVQEERAKLISEI